MDIVPPAPDGATPPKKRGRPRSARCGTRSGYNRHRIDGSDPCDACRAAEREYRNKRYQASPSARTKALIASKAQAKAYQRLAHQFPDLYRTYYQEAKAAPAKAAD